jgi:hypothetical protein
MFPMSLFGGFGAGVAAGRTPPGVAGGSCGLVTVAWAEGTVGAGASGAGRGGSGAAAAGGVAAGAGETSAGVFAERAGAITA